MASRLSNPRAHRGAQNSREQLPRRPMAGCQLDAPVALCPNAYAEFANASSGDVRHFGREEMKLMQSVWSVGAARSQRRRGGCDRVVSIQLDEIIRLRGLGPCPAVGFPSSKEERRP